MAIVQKCKQTNKVIILILTIILFSCCFGKLTKGDDPWELAKDEILVEGVFQGCKDNLILVKINDQLISYPYSSETIVALMGIHSGRLVSLEQFSSGTPIEVFLDKTRTIRAIRNKLEDYYPFEAGTAMENWGHQATLSPNEKYYTTFNLWEGLFVHSLTEKQSSFFLSNQPVCSWNKSGTKIAYAGDNFLGVFDTNKKVNQYYLFPHKNPATVRVVTCIDWNPRNETLLYAFLEDYPGLGSSLFQVSVIGKNDKKAANRVFENLVFSCWFSEDVILLVTNPSEQKTGSIFFWNYKTNKTLPLVNKLAGFCNNFCYNSDKKTLAYTITREWEEGFTEDLYVFSFSDGNLKKIKSFIFPIRHLQWAEDDTLIFWEELNNTINKLDENGRELLKTTGFLPEKGAAKRFLYFPEEPFEEPLPLFLSP